MGAVPAVLVVCLPVLAGPHDWITCFADAAIHQRRQLGTAGTPDMGSGRRQLVAHALVLGADCPGHEIAVQVDGPRRRGDAWRRQGPLLSQHALFSGARPNLFWRLGLAVLLPETLVDSGGSGYHDAAAVCHHPEPERLWYCVLRGQHHVCFHWLGHVTVSAVVVHGLGHALHGGPGTFDLLLYHL